MQILIREYLKVLIILIKIHIVLLWTTTTIGTDVETTPTLTTYPDSEYVDDYWREFDYNTDYYPENFLRENLKVSVIHDEYWPYPKKHEYSYFKNGTVISQSHCRKCKCGKSSIRDNPWMVMIVRDLQTYLCGATLINSRFVLTAAHCIQALSIRNLGCRFRMWPKGLGHPLDHYRSIRHYSNHPQYNPATLAYDITVIELKNSIQSFYEIAPVCLPSSKNYRTQFNRGHVTAWKGFKGSSGLYFVSQITEQKVPIYSHKSCKNKINSMHSRSICAGQLQKESTSTCLGHSGGPLTVKHNGRWIQKGVLSWGYGCQDVSNLAVFVDTASVISWIRKKSSGTKSCWCQR